jgi:hypothetical protein
VVEPGAFFEVTDGEFNGGVFTVEPVGCGTVEVGPVGDEGVVTSIRP